MLYLLLRSIPNNKYRHFSDAVNRAIARVNIRTFFFRCHHLPFRYVYGDLTRLGQVCREIDAGSGPGMPAVRCKNPLRVVRWHGSEGMLCLVLIIPCDPQEGAGEEDAFHDGGAGEGPPDAVEAERAAQDDREWDAGAGEGDAQDAA